MTGTPGTTSSAGALLVALLVAAVTASFRRPPPRRSELRRPGPTVRGGLRLGAWSLAAWRRTIGTDGGDPAPRAVGDWCDDLARTVRAGSTLRDALRTVVPTDVATARATASVRHRLERGATIGAAVDGTEGGPHLQLAVNVVAIAGRLGGSPAIAIERTAGALRQRGADRDERSVQAAQARLSAHVLTAVPVAMLGLLCVVDPDVLAAARSSTGAASIGVGLAINALGWWWMRRIVGRSG